MDRNTIIGFGLIFLILMVWQWMAAPSQEQIEAQKRYRDSLVNAERISDSLEKIAAPSPSAPLDSTTVQKDSVALAKFTGKFGVFADAATGTETTYALENDLMRITFSNKGATIKEVFLKNYFKLMADSSGKEQKLPLKLLEDAKNQFEFLLPIRNAEGGKVNSTDLYFSATQSTPSSLVFKADAGAGRFFEISYNLKDEDYLLDFQLKLNGLEGELSEKSVSLNWVNYLDKIEKNHEYERNYSTVYYKPTEESPDNCSCTGDDKDEPEGGIKWISHTQQFFNTTVIAETGFSKGTFQTEVLDADQQDLKKLVSFATLPLAGTDNTIALKLYSGPNEFSRLQKLGNNVEDIIPFGWSIFGTINRWVIRPIFNFLSTFVGSKGIVILLLTLIVKAFLYPLTYRMILSQSKMSVLKPEISKLKEKLKDDQQAQQIETMKMYREFGVNPLGGCMPILLQMPIWFALYRFFPAAIEFRQQSFLWATDLSSYDVIAKLPFEIPAYGAHISLFTIIWIVTTLAYTWYNSQFVDFSANPMMKYLQYIMPVIFIVFFNKFAAGLTAYLCFSNVLNI